MTRQQHRQEVRRAAKAASANIAAKPDRVAFAQCDYCGDRHDSGRTQAVSYEMHGKQYQVVLNVCFRCLKTIKWLAEIGVAEAMAAKAVQSKHVQTHKKGYGGYEPK